jgi:hypothetical protein
MPYVDVGESATNLVEGVLEVRLIEPVHLRPAAAAGLGEVELGEHCAGTVPKAIPPYRVELRYQRLGDSECGKGAHRLVVEDAGSWKVVEPRQGARSNRTPWHR